MKHQNLQFRSKITFLLTQALVIGGASLSMASHAQSLPSTPMPDAGRILETIKQTPTPNFSSDAQPQINYLIY